MGLTMVVSLFSGLALFLYGMKLLSDGLQKTAGDKMKRLLEILTANRFVAVIAGALITAIIQSSSATTVMVVGFVNAGIMSLVQATGVIMGANIGTTITAVLVAFQLKVIIPYAVIIGAFLLLFTKKKKYSSVGEFILGFGLLFMGMYAMSDAMAPLRELQAFADLMVKIQGSPLLGVLAGLAITAVIQSSSAAIGIIQALAMQGLIPIDAALPILFGSNIGTCATVLLASIGASITAKRASFVHLLFNVIGTVVFVIILKPVLSLVVLTSDDTVKQIANAHILFNISNTLLLLPFLNQMVALVTKLIPGKDDAEVAELHYLDKRILETPSIAVVQLIKEIVRFAEIAKENTERAVNALLNNDEQLALDVFEKEKIINKLEQNITEYLVALSNTNLSEQQSNLVSSLFNTVHDVERIGDHADNLAEMAITKIQQKVIFSDMGQVELREIGDMVKSNVEGAIKAFMTGSHEDFAMVEKVEQEIDEMEESLRRSHIKRLNTNECNINSGVVFLDILTNLERISDHCVNIAETMIINDHPHNLE